MIEWCFWHVLSGNSRVICTIQLLGVKRKRDDLHLDTDTYIHKYIHTYTSFMLEIHSVAVEQISSRK